MNIKQKYSFFLLIGILFLLNTSYGEKALERFGGAIQGVGYFNLLGDDNDSSVVVSPLTIGKKGGDILGAGEYNRLLEVSLGTLIPVGKSCNTGEFLTGYGTDGELLCSDQTTITPRVIDSVYDDSLKTDMQATGGTLGTFGTNEPTESFLRGKRAQSVLTAGEFNRTLEIIQKNLQLLGKQCPSGQILHGVTDTGLLQCGTFGGSVTDEAIDNQSVVQGQLTNVPVDPKFTLLGQDDVSIISKEITEGKERGDNFEGGEFNRVLELVAMSENMIGSSCATDEYVNGFDNQGNLVCSTVGTATACTDNDDYTAYLNNDSFRSRNSVSTSVFTALKSDGTTVTWGDSTAGGDSSAVQAQLTNVKDIYANSRAIAALKNDGTVVTWGDSIAGGDSSAVQADLVGVQKIASSPLGFVALKNDGTVVAWPERSGSGFIAKPSGLSDVKEVYASRAEVFAALKNDGTVVTWGSTIFGADTSSIQSQLTDIKDITVSNEDFRYTGLNWDGGVAFAALKNDGTVVTWGTPTAGVHEGSDSSAVQSQLTNVKKIYATSEAFAALKNDGTVVTWGDGLDWRGLRHGGDSSGVQSQLTNVKEIYSTGSAFAALKNDGTVVIWGEPLHGGDASAVQSQLTNVKKIYANLAAFAALKDDGTVVAWGADIWGGDSSGVQSQLTDVSSIHNTAFTFAALKNDGTVVTWGGETWGMGDSSAVQSQLTNVKNIYTTWGAFAFLRGDGTVVTWGGTGLGGDSSAVQSQLTNVVNINGGCEVAITPPTCTDGIQNGTETGVDCGGSCPSCSERVCEDFVGKNKYCTGMTGAAFPPGEGVMVKWRWGGTMQACKEWCLEEVDTSCIWYYENGLSSSIDHNQCFCMGGGSTRPINSHMKFWNAGDYYAAGCITGPAPTCSDGIQNGTETGVDCGGSCPSCPVIIGQCGSSLHNTGSSVEPTDPGLCSTGIATTVSSRASTWEWTCQGQNGGADSGTCLVHKQSEQNAGYGYNALAFNNDGTKMFLAVGNRVLEYSLGTAFDVSTTVSGPVSHWLSTAGGRPSVAGSGPADAIAFSNDGTRLITTEGTSGAHANPVLSEYSLSTPFDLSTATYAGIGQAYNATKNYYNRLQGMKFSNDGMKIFMVGYPTSSNPDSPNALLIEYTLGTAFDVSTIDSSSRTQFVVDAEDAEPTALALSNDGTKVFIIGKYTKSVHEYNLGTAFDISTATYAGSGEVFDLSPSTSTLNIHNGFSFNTDGTKMFITGYDSSQGYEAVYEYNLGTAFDVSTASYAGSGEDFPLTVSGVQQKFLYPQY